ncbi:hypothetical protein D9M69_651390 [compost metagenome]
MSILSNNFQGFYAAIFAAQALIFCDGLRRAASKDEGVPGQRPADNLSAKCIGAIDRVFEVVYATLIGILVSRRDITFKIDARGKHDAKSCVIECFACFFQVEFAGFRHQQLNKLKSVFTDFMEKRKMFGRKRARVLH